MIFSLSLPSLSIFSLFSLHYKHNLPTPFFLLLSNSPTICLPLSLSRFFYFYFSPFLFYVFSSSSCITCDKKKLGKNPHISTHAFTHCLSFFLSLFAVSLNLYFLLSHFPFLTCSLHIKSIICDPFTWKQSLIHPLSCCFSLFICFDPFLLFFLFLFRFLFCFFFLHYLETILMFLLINLPTIYIFVSFAVYLNLSFLLPPFPFISFSLHIKSIICDVFIWKKIIFILLTYSPNILQFFSPSLFLSVWLSIPFPLTIIRVRLLENNQPSDHQVLKIYLQHYNNVTGKHALNEKIVVKTFFLSSRITCRKS